ncbi:MAG TPA: hypothetical protein VM933_02145 [Acidimicrobiales bacterium]|nr:hypothetical protein [Acidimicrobiales bacterium]
MDEPRSEIGPEDLPSTDAVLSESVERVRSSRVLLDEIDLRLQRGQRLLDDEPAAPPPTRR